LDDIVLSTGQGLDEHIKDSRPEKGHIDSNRFQMLAKGGKTPLESKVIMLCTFILDKVIVFLVNGIVG
jgi:hypothetical protein